MILSLDIGSSSVRAALYDSNGSPLPRASARIDRVLTATVDGGAEIDADKALDQVVAAIDAVLAKTDRLRHEIAGVAACSFWHSLVGVDNRGKPTTKVLGWADRRSGKYSAVLKKRFDESENHNRTGAHFHSSYWPAKLLWFKNDLPQVFAHTAMWLSLSDYIALKLFGTAATSISMASGTGIFDIRKCEWDAKLLKYLNLKPVDLPVLSDGTFRLTARYARRWPRLANARWFPAIADGVADNIGAGCLIRSKAALMVGTSGAMRVAYKGEPPAKIPDGLWCYRIDRERVIVGGALSDGGGLYAWLKTNLRLPNNAEEEIERRPRGTHGLTFRPFLAGERSTGYREDARGAISGLTSANDALDILQAAMESVALQFADIHKRLSSVFKIKTIVASGGALRDSPVWSQIIASALDHGLIMNDVRESALLGAVLLAIESDGKMNGIN